MSHCFSQLDDGASADVETASAFGMAVAMVASSACNMDPSKIAAVENILNYKFKNKNLLVEALTHSSFSEKMSYERLEFLGDAALGLAVANHFFILNQRQLTPGQLTKLREHSVCNKKLARMAAVHGLYRFVRKENTAPLDHYVKTYEEAVKHGHETSTYPDILADIVESLAGAVYLDVNCDLTKLWMIFRNVLEVDEIKLPTDGGDESSEITGAQDKLYALCGPRKWGKPVYRLKKDEGRPHEKKFVSSVKISTADVTLNITGDEKSRVRKAENSAASFMIRALQDSGHLSF